MNESIIGSLIEQKISATNGFYVSVDLCKNYKQLYLYRFIPVTMKYRTGNICQNPQETMNNSAPGETTQSLVWVVLAKGTNGCSEVIKVTNHEEADRYVMNNPSMYYKSGPVLFA